MSLHCSPCCYCCWCHHDEPVKQFLYGKAGAQKRWGIPPESCCPKCIFDVNAVTEMTLTFRCPPCLPTYSDRPIHNSVIEQLILLFSDLLICW